jgi:serine/threonine protein phosphatase PrpC
VRMYPEPTGEVRMTLSLRFAAGSHKGMIREGNEDSGYAGPRLLAIADGMGGQAAGEVASSEVISTLVQLDDDVPGSDILTSLGSAVQRANDQLRVMVEEDPQLEGMGTTLTALLWTGQRLGLVHVGDSRAYLLRDGVLTQITQDHTWVQRLVDEGRITEEEAGTHPQRSLLMRALDGRGQVEPDLSIREVRAGDRYLICSDGLSSVVSHQTLEEALAGYQPPSETIQQLIQLALRGGGPDNITCIVADVLDIEDGDATGANQFHDVPVVVGAVADSQHPLTDQQHLQTPAGRASELGRPQPPEGAFGPPGSGDTLVGAAPLGSFGAFEGEATEQPRKKRRWLKRSAAAIAVLGLLGGGLYGAYRWTQTQYYVGVNGDHAAIYQGLSQKLGPISLSKVHQDRADVQLQYLPVYTRNSVVDTIAVADLVQAESKAKDLAHTVEVCRTKQAIDKAREQAARAEAEKRARKPTPKPSSSSSALSGNGPSVRKTTGGTASQIDSTGTSPSPSTSPTLSPEDQTLAQQCPSGQ